MSGRPPAAFRPGPPLPSGRRIGSRTRSISWQSWSTEDTNGLLRGCRGERDGSIRSHSAVRLSRRRNRPAPRERRSTTGRLPDPHRAAGGRAVRKRCDDDWTHPAARGQYSCFDSTDGTGRHLVGRRIVTAAVADGVTITECSAEDGPEMLDERDRSGMRGARQPQTTGSDQYARAGRREHPRRRLSRRLISTGAVRPPDTRAGADNGVQSLIRTQGGVSTQ